MMGAAQLPGTLSCSGVPVLPVPAHHGLFRSVLNQLETRETTDAHLAAPV